MLLVHNLTLTTCSYELLVLPYTINKIILSLTTIVTDRFSPQGYRHEDNVVQSEVLGSEK